MPYPNEDLVQRISKKSLDKLLSGKITEEGAFVIKVYSNTCHYCHELHRPYMALALSFLETPVSFLAFNVEDDPGLQHRLDFKGVPTVFMLKTGKRFNKINVEFLSEPAEPDPHSWYTFEQMRTFVTEGM